MRIIDKAISNKKMIFLGGTCNNSIWRNTLIPLIDTKYEIFNPVVADWTPECQEKEIEARKNADFVVYVITPRMTGVYSIAEVIDDSNKRPEKTIFCFLHKDYEDTFSAAQIKSLAMVGRMVKENGGTWLNNLEEIAEYLNRS